MSGGIDIFGMVAGLGKSFGDSYAAARAQAQEDEAPALIQGLLKNYQSAGAPAAPALPAGAEPAPASGAPGRSLPFFARAQGALPSEKLKGLIADVATKNELDPGYLSKLVSIESGGNPSAYNKGSGASGLGQFIPSTAKAYGLADPFDPVANLNATARFTLDNRNSLRTALGRDPTPGELYLGHQQGAGGAARLLRNPDMPAARLVGMKAVTSNGGRPDMTARDFAGLWTSRFDSDTPRIAQAAAPAAPAPAPTPAPGLPAFAQPGGPVRTMPALGATAAAEPEADRPAPGAQPVQFVVPPGAPPAAPAPAAAPMTAPPSPIAFGGFGSGASRMSPELATALTAAWRNPNTRAIATSVLGQVLAGKDSSWSIADLGNGRKALFDAKTARLVQLPGTGDSYGTETDADGNLLSVNAATGERKMLRAAERPQTVSAGNALVDNQGREIYRSPANPTTVAPGSALVGPDGKELYRAAPKAEPFTLKPGETRFENGAAVAAIPDREKGAESEAKLRGEFTKQLGDFPVVQDGYRRVIAATEQREANPNSVSPASDIALIFGYMKMLDPGSVVREGEYATAQNAAGVPERIQNAYNKALSGEFLLPDQRQDFLDTAARLYGQARTQVEATAGRYRDLARGQGLNEANVVHIPDAPVAPTVGAKKGGPSPEKKTEAPEPAKQPAPKYGSVKIPMDAVRELKGLPDTAATRAQFDGVFGEGAAARILGRAKQ